MSKTEFYLNKIIHYGLYAILLTPLVFWPKALYGFLTPKFLLFQILVEIVFGAWVALLVLRNTNIRMHANDTNWRKWLIISLFIFIGISFLSAIFGVDFQRSFWGIGARMTGLFAELHFLAWFLVLASVATQHNPNLQIYPNSTNSTNNKIGSIRMSLVDWDYYLNFSFAVSLIVAATAFYQNTQWHLAQGYTIFSNPTFVAPYFLFHFFWGLYQTFASSLNNPNQQIYPNSTNNKIGSIRMSFVDWDYYKRWLFAAGSALILWAIFLGQIRGAFIGLLLGILFLGIGLIFSDIFKVRSRVLIAALYAIIVLGLMLGWQFRDSKFIEQSYFSRFSHISFEEATVQTRFLTWQAAFKGFYDKPLLGVGPENFNYLFNANYNPRLLMYGGSSFAETWQDKPHNAFVEILTETGIIGSLAYILIWFFVVFYLFRIFKHNQTNTSIIPIMEAKFLSFILASAFISYLVTVFFSFDSFGSWFGLFLFLAFLAASHSNLLIPRIEESAPLWRGGGRILGINKLRLFIMGIAIFVIFLILINLSIWRANLADADALRIFSQNPKSGIALFEKSLSYKSPYKSEYQFDLIASVAGAVEKGVRIDNLENIINFALDEAEKAVSTHPKIASGYTDMARIYNIFGTRGRDPEILARAEQFGKKSLELSPNRQETLFYLARTALLQNKPAAAVEWAKQAVAADSTIGASHWYLGLSLIADNQKTAGIIEIKKALELGYQLRNQSEKDFVKNLGL